MEKPTLTRHRLKWIPLEFCLRKIQGMTTPAAILYAAWLALFITIFFRSWVSEDAYITFRVVENALNGHGLRWNIIERVQVYTHPLWLLLHLPVAAFSNNLFFVNIGISLFCASAAVALVLCTFRKSLGVMLVCFMLPLFCSKAFLEYATSGLETSLGFLLFSCVGFVLLRLRDSHYFWFYLSLTVALSLLNRLDVALIFAPMLLLFAKQHGWQRLPYKQIMLGAAPLLLWLVFSLWYYGFLFPNTKYAKLDTGIALTSYLTQGLHYLFIWFTHDTMSALITTAAISSLFVHRCPLLYKAIALGILMYIAYVIYIGGDYMMGRFFAFPFFVSLWLLLAWVPHTLRGDILFATAAALLCAASAPYFVKKIRAECKDCIPVQGKVIDARTTFHRNRLFVEYWPPKVRREGEFRFAEEGRKIAAEQNPAPRTLRYVGMIGYYAGAKTTLVDEYALSDALLSRLPATANDFFYVGHYKRAIPEGYMEAVGSGTSFRMDQNLARYYEKLKLITQGNLWSKERLHTIITFNMGQYDYLKQAYLAAPN